MIESENFAEAVVSIQKRAEKQSDWGKLSDVFVKSDLWDRAHAQDSQLVLGRRGTGKTHLFRVLHEDSLADNKMSMFIDCTSLGSGFSSIDISPTTIATKYFRALLNQIGTALLDAAIRLENPPKGKLDRILTLLSAGFAPDTQDHQGEDPSLFNYRQINETLGNVIRELGHTRTVIVLDEWAQVHQAAQPHLAEFIKRSILSVPSVSIKILAVNYQCRFSTHQDGNTIGLERGSDMPEILDLDRYLVFDEKRDFVTEFFGQVLFNHIGAELDWDLGLDKHAKAEKAMKLFTAKRAFIELVRAAEGNTRDFLCIFSRAYFDEFRQSGKSTSISIPNVTKAASDWYEQEKSSTINSETGVLQTLSFLMNNVLKEYKSRSFLVEQAKAQDTRLVRLLNERVLHKLNQTYSHPNRPGVVHEIFSIDYGAYVRFRGTVNAVEEQVFWQNLPSGDQTAPQHQDLVPVDDKRSIRRIIFDPDKIEVEAIRPTPQQGKGDLANKQQTLFSEDHLPPRD